MCWVFQLLVHLHQRTQLTSSQGFCRSAVISSFQTTHSDQSQSHAGHGSPNGQWLNSIYVTWQLYCNRLTRSSMLWLPLLWWTHFVRMLTWLKLRINLKHLAQKQTEKIATAIIMMMTNWRQILVRCHRKEKEFPTLRTLSPALLKRLWGNITLVYNSHVKEWNFILSTMSISFSGVK